MRFGLVEMKQMITDGSRNLGLPVCLSKGITLQSHWQMWVSPNPLIDIDTNTAGAKERDTWTEQSHNCPLFRVEGWQHALQHTITGRNWFKTRLRAAKGRTESLPLIIKDSVASHPPLQRCSPENWWGRCVLYSWGYRVWSDCHRLRSLLLMSCSLHSVRE